MESLPLQRRLAEQGAGALQLLVQASSAATPTGGILCLLLRFIAAVCELGLSLQQQAFNLLSALQMCQRHACSELKLQPAGCCVVCNSR